MSDKNKRGAGLQADIVAVGMQLSIPIADEAAKESGEDKGKDFEEALAELEEVVSHLEGEVKLEEALKLFDRGMKLSQDCEAFLKTAEQKIEVLKKAVNGNLSTEKFNEESLQNT